MQTGSFCISVLNYWRQNLRLIFQEGSCDQDLVDIPEILGNTLIVFSLPDSLAFGCKSNLIKKKKWIWITETQMTGGRWQLPFYMKLLLPIKGEIPIPRPKGINYAKPFWNYVGSMKKSQSDYETFVQTKLKIFYLLFWVTGYGVYK